MTGHLTAQAAQAQTHDMILRAEHHRQAHREQLNRLVGRWIPFTLRRPQAAVAPALMTQNPCS